jgi:hypothetical protein
VFARVAEPAVLLVKSLWLNSGRAILADRVTTVSHLLPTLNLLPRCYQDRTNTGDGPKSAYGFRPVTMIVTWLVLVIAPVSHFPFGLNTPPL